MLRYACSMVDINAKELVVFDLDGTLAESKQAMDGEMADLLQQLLARRRVAVIGGGSYAQFEKQFTNAFPNIVAVSDRVFLFPTCSTQFYRYDNGWREVYAEVLSEEEKATIITTLQNTLRELNYPQPATLYGEQIEDRRTQISFSPLGQEAPVSEKAAWKEQYDALRLQVLDALAKALPAFEVRAGGMTTIDITRAGIDKAYGIRQIEKLLNIPITAMVFVGDALFEGGNDYPAKQAGVDCIQTDGPEHTKLIIREWLSALAS